MKFKLMSKLIKPRYIATAAAMFIVAQGHAFAQVTLDNLLGTVSVSGTAACSHVDVALNRPVNIHGLAPADHGLEVSAGLDVLGTTQDNKDKVARAEGASVPPQNAAGLGSVSYDPASSGGAEIHLSFAKVVAYKLRRSTDNRHLILDVAPLANAAKCLGFKVSDGADAAGKTDALRPTQDSEDLGGKLPSQQAVKALADGKTQMAEGDFNRAAAFFTKASELGTGRVKQDAQEMLGLAHERGGQLAFAQAEYESYLSSYPIGADATRVKQRLEGVVAAMDGQAGTQFALRQNKQDATALPTAPTVANAAPNGPTGLPPMSQQNSAAPAPGVQITNQGMKSNLIEKPKDPHAWAWQQNGSVAQFYYADQNYVPATIGGPLFANGRMFQNEVLSSFDYFVKGENDAFAVEMRASAYNEQGFGDMSNVSNTSASTIYLDGKLKGPRIGVRVGRQSRGTGGVFGRFDGANISWEPTTNLKLQAVGGSPVFGQNAVPFSSDHYFYGVSLDYASPGKNWSGGGYAIQQMVGDITDRSALGGELRYNNQKGSGFVAADYDIYFKEFNNAYATVNLLPWQGTTVYGTVDYRKMPFLLTSNALMGQQNIGSLQELRDAIGIDNLYQCALDRTASAQTESAGVSQQLSKKWQASIDGTLAYYTGTPASSACSVSQPSLFFTPDPGFNFYGSVTLSGSEILHVNDTVTASLRYSNSGNYVGYMLDGSYRYQVNEKLRFMPRFQASMRNSLTSDQMQLLAGGSLSAYYKLRSNWSLEAELGARWQDNITTGISSPQMDLIASMGYRWDFH